MISAVENSNKFHKTRFWKEKSVEDVLTLGPTAHATLVITYSKGTMKLPLKPDGQSPF
jgi:hypothetical protein